MKFEHPVSIITVCFNSEDTIAKTIRSLKKQTSQNYEYIVIDGCSTDNTLDIIARETGKDFEGRLKVISEPDEGIYDAMNKGIEIAQGKVIGILNSDDWYEPYTIEEVERALLEHSDFDIFYGYIRIVKNGKEYMVRRNNYDFISEGHGLIQHPACFIRKSAYQAVGNYDSSFRVCADQDLMLRMVKSGKRYHPIDAILTNFSVGGISDNYDSTFEVLRFKLRHGIINRQKYLRMYSVSSIKSALKTVLTFGRDS